MRPNSTEAYVANAAADTVSVLDTASRTGLKQIPVDHGPHSVVFSPDRLLAFVAMFGDIDGTVDVIDAESRTLVASIQVGLAPHQVVVSDDGMTAYVANYGGASVSIIDTASLTAVGALPTDGFPTGLAFASGGAELYVSHLNSDRASHRSSM
jgi:YVTN family beta-propeller protein